MGIIQNISEAMSIKNIAAMFNTGYTAVSPRQTQYIPLDFQTSLNSKYNISIANAFIDSDPRKNALANILATMYTQTYQTKKELFELYRSVKDLDQASAIIDDFIDDAFNTPDSDYPFTIRIKDNVYDKEEIEKNLQKFVKKFDIYQLDHDTNEDYLVYGDYYLYTKPKIGEGIIEIYDNVDVENVFSIYKGTKLIQHIAMDRNSLFSGSPVSGWAGQLKAIHPDLLSHFILDTRKIKLKSPFANDTVFNLHENICIGRSVLFSSLALLKKYQILDSALTYKELRNALMPIILGVSTGAFTTPDDMIEACKTMESYLQDGTAMSFDLENADTLQDLLQGSTSIKVAPMPGDKGNFNKLEIGSAPGETDGINKILDDTGNRIAKVSGGVTIDDSGKSRLEILKANSRRSKKLIDIQKGKSMGWRNLLHKHLRYQHINIEKESIDIKYKSIPNADIFEEANGLVTLLSVVNDLQTFSDSVAQSSIGVQVNPQKLIDAFNLFIGNRYKILQDFLELPAVKEQFPGVDKALSQPQTMINGVNPGQPTGPEVKTGVNNATKLTQMNKKFTGSSGTSDATGI